MKYFFMSTKKIILIIICVVIALYVGVSVWKYNTLINLNKKYIESTKSSNLHYYMDSDASTLEYWRKDNIIKKVMKRKDNNIQLIWWGNYDTNEILFIVPSSQQYSDENNFSPFDQLPTSQFVTSDSPTFLMSILPNFIIYSKDYNNEKCYCLKFGSITEYVSIDNGLSIFYRENNVEATRKYGFDTVTDEDVAKPDLTGYSYIQQEN